MYIYKYENVTKLMKSIERRVKMMENIELKWKNTVKNEWMMVRSDVDKDINEK